MPRKYLYLDDETPHKVRPYMRAVEAQEEGLELELVHPKPYGKQIDELAAGEFDGLILDLRLDMYSDWQAGGTGDKADYRASTLAQEVRTRSAEHSKAAERRGRGEYPIVLWSTDSRLDASYARDHTSHDLFDLMCVKEHIVSDGDEVAQEKKAPWVAKRLLALADGYDEIAAVRNEIGTRKGQFSRFLGFDTPPHFLDERLIELDPFDHRRLFRPTHEYARFIRRELLETTGPLIDVGTLAARLGIDTGRSGDFVRLVAEHFAEAAYSGPFASGWPRWWARRVEDAWRGLVKVGGSAVSLRSVPASERVQRLREYTGLKMIRAAAPLHEGGSTRYWVMCQATKRPLDPREGFVLETRRRFPWQGDEYVSLHALQEGTLAKRGFVLAPGEQKRAEAARKRKSA